MPLRMNDALSKQLGSYSCLNKKSNLPEPNFTHSSRNNMNKNFNSLRNQFGRLPSIFSFK